MNDDNANTERECLITVARAFEAWCEDHRYSLPGEFRIASAACCRLWRDIYSGKEDSP